MSKKQWGHGYWNGVNDAINGKVKLGIKNEAMFWAAAMCVANAEKQYSRLVFPVRLFIAWCVGAGLSTQYAKRIYDYIIINEPYNCYVSGDAHSAWINDSFILPNGTKEEWIAKLGQFQQILGQFYNRSVI